MPTTHQGTDPVQGSRPSAVRPGRMTAVMRAARLAAGPKVLRIGLCAGGRILEERLVKQRTSVTVGPGERSTFVVDAEVPPRFKLFELVGGDYHLNVLDGMTGRVALPTGLVDLGSLRAHRLRLTEDARGKVVVGEATFLFQFVPSPPAGQRPQLPLSVRGGLADRIDWRFTIIAAMSFLVHFGLVGALYGDWADPIVDEQVTARFIGAVTRAEPLPVETPSATLDVAATDSPPVAEQAPRTKADPRPLTPAGHPPSALTANDLLSQVSQTRVAILVALGADGPALKAALGANESGAPVNLDELANKPDGVRNIGSEGLNLPGMTGPIRPGTSPLVTMPIDAAPVPSTVGPIARIVHVDVQSTPPTISVPVANAEATIRIQIQPGARRCYQKGLQVDPTQAGRLVIVIKVAPGGEVDSASVSSNGGLSTQVAGCIAAVAQRAKFDAPGAHGSTISVPFTFVRQGG